MTTSRQFSESEGEFTAETRSSRPCRQCGSHTVTVRTWESSDGAYEDYKYTCRTCGAIWWIDGIDS